MKINSTVEKGCTGYPTFPFIGEHPIDKDIILFTDESEGILLSDPCCSMNSKVGDVVHQVAEDYVVTDKHVILSNDLLV